MISNSDISNIEKLLNNKIIKYSKILSNSFGINCVKLVTNDNENYIVKFYNNNNYKEFNAIYSETKNLIFINKLNINLFPYVYCDDKKYLIISFINNNGEQPTKTNDDFLKAIITLHSLKNEKYGFDFDTQIGGLRQKNNKSKNWVNFYRDNRLGYIYQLITLDKPMSKFINDKIELILKNLENYIPKNPKPSLLHGDLWEGNILFDNYKFAGFIDPGSFYGHNELEIAYLRWFNPAFIDKNFISKYSNFINIDKEYFKYEPIYQLYYSLLNVHLWDRKYVKDISRLLKKIKI